jgi:hypothetical protein
VEKQYYIRTETGSSYRWYIYTDGTQFVSGKNVANQISLPIGDDAFQIEPAETPIIGQEWLFNALKSLKPGDPKRMPGGGKLTSRVIEFVECQEN